MTTNYPTDLSDSQWQVIKGYVKDKRKRKYSYRVLFNAIFYLVKTGCQWRMLPGDFAPWKTGYCYFSVWEKGEIFEVIHVALGEK